MLTPFENAAFTKPRGEDGTTKTLSCPASAHSASLSTFVCSSAYLPTALPTTFAARRAATHRCGTGLLSSADHRHARPADARTGLGPEPLHHCAHYGSAGGPGRPPKRLLRPIGLCSKLRPPPHRHGSRKTGFVKPYHFFDVIERSAHRQVDGAHRRRQEKHCQQ